MARLFILRHGETEGNQKKIFRGRWDLPLNENGRKQAEKTGEVLKEINFSRIYASPLLRARETAAAVAAKQKRIKVIEEPALIDIDYGDWTRVSDTDVEQRFPDMYRKWKETPENVLFPNGESLSDVSSRLEPFLQRLGSGPDDEQILLVSHRVTIKIILCIILRLGNKGFWNISIDTTSLSVATVNNGKMCLVTSNDTCHLKTLADKFNSVDF